MTIEKPTPQDHVSGREVVKGALIGLTVAAALCLIEYFVSLDHETTIALNLAGRLMDAPSSLAPDSAIQAWGWIVKSQLALGSGIGALVGLRPHRACN
jgi:hypothetical protein